MLISPHKSTMHPITSLTDYEKNRIAGDTELFSPRNQEQAEEERPLFTALEELFKKMKPRVVFKTEN